MKSLSLRLTNRLTANVIANVIQMLGGSALLFALYRYINSVLGVAQLGVWSVVVASVSASRLADLGLSAGVTRFVARDRGTCNLLGAVRVIDTATLTLASSVGLLLPVFYFLAVKAFPHFLQSGNLEQALKLLPVALASLWLTIIASVFQGGLDGCQRMDLRAGLVLVGQLLLLLLSIWLVPICGLVGLAWAQMGQSIFLMVVGRLLLCKVMPKLPWLPWRWSRAVLREMVGYGANLQAGTLFIVLFDPFSKILMARFGGPATAGYFEMASQVVLKCRSVIVAANQAIVPHVAEWTHVDLTKVGRFYRDNTRILVFVTLPAITLVIAVGPLASTLLIGEYNPEFVRMLSVLAVVWGFNILSVPAYFTNMGTGHVGMNTLAHVATGVVSVALGLLLGPRIGVLGVLLGYATGILVGTFVLLRNFTNRYRIVVKLNDHREHARLCFAFIAVTFWAAVTQASTHLQGVGSSVGTLVAALLLVGVTSWHHAIRGELLDRRRPASGR